MASSRRELNTDLLEIFTDDILGVGSYGKVCRAKRGQLPCAAKLLHDIMFQDGDPGASVFLERFEQECHFLSSIKHPNIVQYLATVSDPNSKRPVLLMELMDESLTKFLERSTTFVPYHIQVNICYDVALALAYLHSNGIIHRDLSGNNVLLIGSGNRAKVTDFGMSRLIDIDPRMTQLTQCPGTLAYMPPETLIGGSVYSNKLDCFSFGVLSIQIMTRNFPNPGEAGGYVEDPKYPNGRVLIQYREVDRRKKDIDLIESNHPLLPMALNCLKDRDVDRPSADELCEPLAALKTEMGCACSNMTDIRNENLQVASEQEETDIREPVQLIWRNGNSAPEKITSTCGTMVAKDSHTVFIARGHNVYSYKPSENKWNKLQQDCPHQHFSLAVIGDKLTAIGGTTNDDSPTNSLLSLKGFWIGKKWKEYLPPMPTKRMRPATHTIDQTHLVVAGGRESQNGRSINTVEILDTATRQWSRADKLIEMVENPSITVSGEYLYLCDGYSNTAFSCSVESLLQSCSSFPSTSASANTKNGDSVWKVLTVPEYESTLVTVGEYVLAIGGSDDFKPKGTIHCYDRVTNSWTLIGEMPTARYGVLATALANNELVVAGGYTGVGITSSVTEVAQL